MNLNIEHGRLVDLAEAFEASPTDGEIVDALVEAFDLAPAAVVGRLGTVDVPAARREVTP